MGKLLQDIIREKHFLEKIISVEDAREFVREFTSIIEYVLLDIASDKQWEQLMWLHNKYQPKSVLSKSAMKEIMNEYF